MRPVVIDKKTYTIRSISLGPVELPCVLDLTPSILSSHRQVHCVSSASVGASISQPRDVLLYFPTEVVFDLQGIEVRG